MTSGTFLIVHLDALVSSLSYLLKVGYINCMFKVYYDLLSGNLLLSRVLRDNFTKLMQYQQEINCIGFVEIA